MKMSDEKNSITSIIDDKVARLIKLLLLTAFVIGAIGIGYCVYIAMLWKVLPNPPKDRVVTEELSTKAYAELVDDQFTYSIQDIAVNLNGWVGQVSLDLKDVDIIQCDTMDSEATIVYQLDNGNKQVEIYIGSYITDFGAFTSDDIREIILIGGEKYESNTDIANNVRYTETLLSLYRLGYIYVRTGELIDETSANKTNTNKTNTNKTNTNKTDTNKTNTNETSANEADTNETDTNKTNTNETSANEADTNETDTNKNAKEQLDSQVIATSIRDSMIFTQGKLEDIYITLGSFGTLNIGDLSLFKDELGLLYMKKDQMIDFNIPSEGSVKLFISVMENPLLGNIGTELIPTETNNVYVDYGYKNNTDFGYRCFGILRDEGMYYFKIGESVYNPDAFAEELINWFGISNEDKIIKSPYNTDLTLDDLLPPAETFNTVS